MSNRVWNILLGLWLLQFYLIIYFIADISLEQGQGLGLIVAMEAIGLFISKVNQ